MDDNQKQIVELKTKITNLESELTAAKRALFELTDNNDTLSHSNTSVDDGKIIEGSFNGENMVGPEGKIYPVPANYASKSKLVEGDRLKLTINQDGSFLFKQIKPVERKHLIGELKFENNAYHVESEGHNYNVLYASITYHKAKPGDKVTIVVPAEGQPHWSVLENIIHDISPEDREAALRLNEQKVAEEMKAPDVKTESVEAITPTERHLAPDYTESPAEPAKSEPAAGLNINELEIVGPKGTPAPDAVNPQAIVNENQAQPASPASTTEDTRQDTVSELEI